MKPISESQAEGIECPPGLIFLSDGVVQIPAILTEDAWETLQDQEDRAYLSSLKNCTVLVQRYSLEFKMATDETECSFFLSLGNLATIAAGTLKANTPCCTSLPSVRRMIRRAYRSFIYRSALSQNTPEDFSLTQLLMEWDHDQMDQLLESIKGRLRSQRCTQPSTSTSDLPQLSLVANTGWDVDRNNYNGEDFFCIPISHLTIPDDKPELPHTPSDIGSETPSGLLLLSEVTLPDDQLDGEKIETFQSTTADINLLNEGPSPQLKQYACQELTFPRESLNGELLAGDIVQTKGWSWDMFVPPNKVLRTSSSSDVSMTLEPTPDQESPSLLDTIPIQPHPVPMAINYQVSSPSSMITEKTDGCRTEHCSFPPYQNPGTSLIPVLTKAFSGSPSSLNLCSGTEHINAVPVSARDQVDGDEREVLQRRNSSAMRKRGQHSPEEVQTARSPPSWLFESQMFPNAEEGSSCKDAQTPKTALMKPPNVHSDDTSFSYYYRVSRSILDNLSKLSVPNGMLHWAVKQLVPPKQTDHTNNDAKNQPRASPC